MTDQTTQPASTASTTDPTQASGDQMPVAADSSPTQASAAPQQPTQPAQSTQPQQPTQPSQDSAAQDVSPSPVTQSSTPPSSPSSQSDALSVLEAAIAQASQQSDAARQAAEKTLQEVAEETGELAQVLPSAILTATDTLNPAAPTTTAKEAEGLKSPDKGNQAEAGTGIQAVEVEKNPELPPEVEGYINKVEQQADQLPKEIVIADAIKNLPQHHPLPKQPVVILPITPDVEKAGATKSPKFSVRWLVEWSRRVMKMFVGKVIYRQN